jgi:hypothetical protein
MEKEESVLTKPRGEVFVWIVFWIAICLLISFLWLIWGLAGHFPTNNKCVNHNLVPHSPEWIDHILFECGVEGWKYYFNTYLSGYLIWSWRKVLAIKRIIF